MNKTLTEIIQLTQATGTQVLETAVPGLSMISGDVPKQQLAALYKPMIGFTVQGTKILSIGEQDTILKGPCYYVLPLHVPATASVQPAKGGGTYISVGLEINQTILQSLLRDLREEVLPKSPAPFAACEIDEDMMQAWLRLIKLLKTPQHIPALGPAYEREILYRVLAGPQGGALRQLGMKESSFSKISRTVKWLRDNYSQNIEIGDVAAESGMAVNTFHRQFKKATGLSPIQFQKQLRLLEARSLMAFEGSSVADAAYKVGYQSASQFNREYSRFFGATPAKDRAKLKN